ncbi:hypothetical protein ACS0PU_011525 [Formica fusca]
MSRGAMLSPKRYTHQTAFLEKVAACIICGQAVVHVGIICEHVNEKTSSVRSQIQQTLCDEAGRKDDVLRGIEKRASTSDD